jgi:hypothetical protein
MKGKNVGYKRVSSVDQNTERQLAGITPDKVFVDKFSSFPYPLDLHISTISSF